MTPAYSALLFGTKYICWMAGVGRCMAFFLHIAMPDPLLMPTLHIQSRNFLAGPLDGQEEAEATGGLLEPRLPPTVAAFATASGGHSRPHQALLVSSGHGDLQLVSDDLQAVGSGTAH